MSEHGNRKAPSNAPAISHDPFIDEVRALKEAASKRYGHDLAKIAEHLRAIERTHRAGVVRPGSDKPETPGRVA